MSKANSYRSYVSNDNDEPVDHFETIEEKANVKYACDDLLARLTKFHPVRAKAPGFDDVVLTRRM